MDPVQRAAFNEAFTDAEYESFVQCINTSARWPTDFRICETPLFLTDEFAGEVITAARRIVQETSTPAFARHAASAIPSGLAAPNETPHPHFLVVDFGIAAVGGKLVPRLIELQAFPSLFGFQWLLLGCIRKYFPSIPRSWTSSFGGIRDADYLSLLRRTILADFPPENVVLLEIEPEKQKTRIDFAATEAVLGIRSVSVTEVRKRGKELWYEKDGRPVRILRIYNRVIFDELLNRRDLKLDFSFQDELDLTWAGHPNWYFRISKHSLPFLKTEHTSPAFFADEFPASERLQDYVLKPLYSFAGQGVNMDPTPDQILSLFKPHEWILQKKVEYAECVITPHGPRSKAEIRMMFIWPDGGEPTLANNLVRMSQGRMMGVDFNKDKTWVGASIAVHSAAVS